MNINSMSAIGKRVLIAPGLEVGQSHANHWGEIIDGPKVQFGVRKYLVRIELQGRETVQKEVWLPAASLKAPKDQA